VRKRAAFAIATVRLRGIIAVASPSPRSGATGSTRARIREGHGFLPTHQAQDHILVWDTARDLLGLGTRAVDAFHHDRIPDGHWGGRPPKAVSPTSPPPAHGSSSGTTSSPSAEYILDTSPARIGIQYYPLTNYPSLPESSRLLPVRTLHRQDRRVPAASDLRLSHQAATWSTPLISVTHRTAWLREPRVLAAAGCASWRSSGIASSRGRWSSWACRSSSTVSFRPARARHRGVRLRGDADLQRLRAARKARAERSSRLNP